MIKLVLKVKGMHCASCSVLIDKLVGREQGVVSIKTNYGAEKTAIEFDEQKITLEKVDILLHKLGYDLIRPDEAQGGAEEEEKREKKQIETARRRVVASFVLATPIILYYMLIHMFNVPHVHELFDFLNRQTPIMSGSGFVATGAYLTQYLFWIIAQPFKLIASLLVNVANPPFQVDLNYIY